MPTLYDKGEVRFLYPDGWEVADEEALAWPRTVTVRHPSGAYWSLSVFTWTTKPEQLVDEAVRTFHEEYEGVETEEVSEEIGPAEAVGCDLTFYCLDFIVQVKVRSFTIDRRTFLIICQGEDRDFDQLDLVFRAITTGLAQNAAATS